MKHAHIDSDGKLLGWYDPVINNDIPDGCVEVTESVWQAAVSIGANGYKDGVFGSYDFRSEERRDYEENHKRCRAALAYLAETDYKVLPDYDGDTTGVIEKRKEARETVRALEQYRHFVDEEI